MIWECCCEWCGSLILKLSTWHSGTAMQIVLHGLHIAGVPCQDIQSVLCDVMRAGSLCFASRHDHLNLEKTSLEIDTFTCSWKSSSMHCHGKELRWLISLSVLEPQQFFPSRTPESIYIYCILWILARWYLKQKDQFHHYHDDDDDEHRNRHIDKTTWTFLSINSACCTSEQR